MLPSFALVAPLTGAWIETEEWIYNQATSNVAPLTGAWIETPSDNPKIMRIMRRAPHGRVD